MEANWLSVGTKCWALRGRSARFLSKALNALQPVIGKRAVIFKWRRYHINLAGPIPGSTVTLTPVTEELMTRLREHPDREQLDTAFRFWSAGFRTAFVWMEEDRLLCLQWLITPEEIHLTPKLGVWSGLYPPLPPRTGQCEGLYTFTDARGKGVATQFAYAFFDRARSLGIDELVTHVVEQNEPTHKWAKKTGWKQLGNISFLQVDFCGLRNVPLCVHCALTSIANSAEAAGMSLLP